MLRQVSGLAGWAAAGARGATGYVASGVGQVGLVAACTSVVAAGVSLEAGRVGLGLVAPVTRAPRRVVSAVARGGKAVWTDPELPREIVSVLDPRAGRRHRRVATHDDRVHLDVRGLTGPGGARLAALIEHRFATADGLAWWHLNAVTGRVTVALDPARWTAAEVLELVQTAESDAHTDDQMWSRHVDLPGDREPLLAAALALLADVTGASVAVATRALPAPPWSKAARASMALVDAQPRVRRVLEWHLGTARADLVITAGNATAHALSHSPGPLLVDAGQRLCALLELQAARQSWQRWQALLRGPAGLSVSDPLLIPERPRPLPPGPVERFADQAAAGSLLGAVAAFAARRSGEAAADALLVGVPKAARISREAFASALAVSLSRRGALVLDRGAFRRLDRVSVLVVDGSAVRTGQPLVLAAETLTGAWTTAQVWNAGQRLLWPRLDAAARLPIPPPRGREAGRLRLREKPSTTPGPHSRPLRPEWRELVEDERVVGRVLVGRELHPRADSLLAAARRADLRVVLAGENGSSELRSRADELVAPGVPLTRAIHRLQESGHVVALVSARSHKALAAADVALGLAAPTQAGDVHVPWSADVVCEDLATVQQLISATRTARAVSERGRALALSASVLGGLLLVARPRRRAWYREVSPVTGAALVGLLQGALEGVRAGRPQPGPTIPLVPWHGLEADEVLLRLAALPVVEELVETGRRSPVFAHASQLGAPLTSLARYLRQELADPLTPVLTVGAAASAILGAPTDAVLVGSVTAVNALVSALQRRRADRALQLLGLGERVFARRVIGPTTSLAAHPQQLVPPDAREEAVPAEQLHPGDVIVLGPGDLVPADARLLSVDGLELDESGLTGEPVTVDKFVGATPGAAVREQSCMVFEGSVVVAGRGRAVVVAVGEATQAGRAIAAVPRGAGPGGVQAQLRALTDKAVPLSLGGGALVAALGLLRGQSLRAAVTDGVPVAVAAVPEGLPLVATVAQLAAARRLSRHGLLVRSSRTVEALGRVDTMCFDKTGTLTEGVLRLVGLADLHESWTLPEAERSPDARRLLRAAARACPDPQDGPVTHATDRAVLRAADLHLGRQATHVWDPVEEVPFVSNRGYAATLGQSRRTLRLIVKGAPEILLARCTHVLRANGGLTGREVRAFTADDQEAALRTIHDLASTGQRVLLVARRELIAAPDDLEAAVDQLTLMGFIGLVDAARDSTLPVLAELVANGIAVRMITGDHPVTARALAVQLGIPHQHVVTGAELDALDETARTAVVNRSTVFARVTPEQKVRIVEALQRAGKVVAMSGDGSNDAAAIRLADVGIGLSSRSSAAARNAADLVLSTADLTLLLDALVEGRMMWQRVRDAVAILVGGNAGEVAFTVFGTALTGRAPVGTRQLLLVNLLTDMFPAMAVALAHPRAPLQPSELPDGRVALVGAELAATPVPELGKALLRSIALRGAATAVGAGSAWLIGCGTGGRRRASTMGLVALVGTQLGQTLVLGGRSPLVWLTAVGSGAVLVAVVQTPGVSQFFGCTPLDPGAWLVVLASASAATAGSVLVPRLLPLLRRPARAVFDPFLLQLRARNVVCRS